MSINCTRKKIVLKLDCIQKVCKFEHGLIEWKMWNGWMPAATVTQWYIYSSDQGLCKSSSTFTVGVAKSIGATGNSMSVKSTFVFVDPFCVFRVQFLLLEHDVTHHWTLPHRHKLLHISDPLRERDILYGQPLCDIITLDLSGLMSC
jgi:hypothetical protein